MKTKDLQYHLIKRGSKIAVRKYGAKRATKLFEDEGSAMNFLKNMQKDMRVIIHRSDGTVAEITSIYRPHVITFIDINGLN